MSINKEEEMGVVGSPELPVTLAQAYVNVFECFPHTALKDDIVIRDPSVIQQLLDDEWQFSDMARNVGSSNQALNRFLSGGNLVVHSRDTSITAVLKWRRDEKSVSTNWRFYLPKSRNTLLSLMLVTGPERVKVEQVRPCRCKDSLERLKPVHLEPIEPLLGWLGERLGQDGPVSLGAYRDYVEETRALAAEIGPDLSRLPTLERPAILYRRDAAIRLITA